KTRQRCGPISVKTKMLEVRRDASSIAVKWNGGTRKIERLVGCVGHHLDGVGIVYISGASGSLQGSHLYVLTAHQRQQRRNMLRTRHRFIALDIEINIGGHVCCHLVHPLGAAAVLGGGQHDVPSTMAAKLDDLLRV